MGNQLFQYAFAYATAKKLNTKFYIDKRLSNDIISRYFLLTEDRTSPLDRTLFAIKGFKNFFSSFLKLGFYSKLKKLLKLQEIEFLNDVDPKIEMLKLNDRRLYAGFFQSELYFIEYKKDIILQFRLKKEAISQFRKISFSLPQGFKLVVIHVRRTDYIDHDYTLPSAYFHQAIAKIQDPKNYYVIISDDRDFVNKEFDYLLNKYISNHNEIIDFQFLMNANICILSNSSFSWWGAYLNTKKTMVIAPQYWLGQKHKTEQPLGIFIKGWEIISVL
ncbi:alpha-1,2-fucosyltransferase [Pedobacter vanadiisoli]|uniref:Alpha-1,2-fucosyltransferase n=1 Tax=Pedobacter vanadiisoli TaxID=1761975 RepID=A0ABW5MHK8_9SPHI